MKKQLFMFLQFPEFDVVSVNWWSAKFPKQEPGCGKGKEKISGVALVVSFVFWTACSKVKKSVVAV